MGSDLLDNLKSALFQSDSESTVNIVNDMLTLSVFDLLKQSLSRVDEINLVLRNKDWDDLTQVEQDKIKCGGLHFQTVSNDIKFDWVNSYQDFQRKFVP